MGVRIIDGATATADASGTVTFRFPQPVLNHVITGAITVPNSDANGSWSVTVGGATGGRAWGNWTGTQPSPPIQALTAEVIRVVGTGLTAGKSYQAELVGADYDATTDYIEYISPSQPYSTSVAGGTLNFQHNDVLVAAEPAIDLEDGGGLTWTVTDDPAGNRVKVTLATAAHLVQASASIDQAVASALFTAVAWNRNDIDTDAFHSTTVNNTRITIPTGLGGKYAIRFQCYYNPGAAVSNLLLGIRTNGVTYLQQAEFSPPPGASQGWTSIEWLGALVATDYVEAMVYMDGAGPQVLGNASRVAGSVFSATFLGA